MDGQGLHTGGQVTDEAEPIAADLGTRRTLAETAARRVGDKWAEPYQSRVMAEIRSAIATGRSGAVLAPTGSGKSLMVAAAIEDAISLGRPILVLHPDVSLLRQNYAQALSLKAMATARVGTFIAAVESLGDGAHLRNTFDADVLFATNPSLTNKTEDAAFLDGLKAFGARNGVVVIDEGHKAAAEMLGKILKILAEAGGSGIVLTATPFRTDGADPLDPFGASVEHDLIGVATFDEVQATGRTVRTRFDIATGEFEGYLGRDAVNLIETAFLALLAEKKSIDQASQAAFARFFKPAATPADQAIAELIVKATAKIWQRRASPARLAMIHCDSVDFARALSEHLGAQRLPEGHARAGEHPSVAFVVASDIRVYRDGAEQDLSPDRDLGIKKTKRDDILDAARAGAFDILVNVNALGVGTDVPQTDLNILACQERSIGPVKQISGRGERAHVASGKTHQVFVDIGNSILRIFNDIDAMRRNDPERSRRQVRGLAAPIRQQFEMWFDTDPTLPDQITQRLREIRKRDAAADQTGYADPLDPTMPWEDEDALPIPHPFANGLYAAASPRYDSETKAYTSRTALFCDLRAFRIYGPDVSEDLPNWLVITHDEKLNASQAFLCSDLDTAKRYAAFIGVKADAKAEEGEVTGKQREYYRKLLGSGRFVERWLLPFAEPTGLAHATASIDLLKGSLFARLLAHGSTRLVERATGAQEIAHPLKAIVLERPNQITPQRQELLGAYCRLRTRLKTLLPKEPAFREPFSIVTYDPNVLPDTKRFITAQGGRFTVVSDPAEMEKLKPRLAEGLAAAKIIAVGPEGAADTWIRTKAGITRNDPATRARETEFRTLFAELCPVDPATGLHSLTLQRMEAIEIAKAAPGAALSRPFAGAAAALIAVLRTGTTEPDAVTQQGAIVTGIAGGAASFKLGFDTAPLFARFALAKAEMQKRAIKEIQRALEFEQRRVAWGNRKPAISPSSAA